MGGRIREGTCGAIGVVASVQAKTTISVSGDTVGLRNQTKCVVRRARGASRRVRGVLFALALVIVFDTSAQAGYAEGAQAYRRGDLMAAIKLWRQAAWINDDILSQVRLGRLYRDGECLDTAGQKNSVCIKADPIEAYVWFYFAAASVSRIGLTLEAFDTMRQAKSEGLRERERTFLPMVPTDQSDAHQRIIYIFAKRGPEGLFRLGEIYDERRGREEPVTPEQTESLRQFRQFRELFTRTDVVQLQAQEAPPLPSPSLDREINFAASGIQRNNAEALAYYTRAENLGHIVAERLANGLRADLEAQGEAGAAVIASADLRIASWQLPIEFYPAPHSDESVDRADRITALLNVNKLETRLIQHALRALGYYKGAIDNQLGPQTGSAVKLYQGSIGATVNGKLTPEQTVRLIQTGAESGNAVTQTTLGTMYYKGIGEPVDYIRARYWFERASEQNNAAALFNLGVMYRDGRGVSVDRDRADIYFRRAREAGHPGH